jgi:hypothetical protein
MVEPFEKLRDLLRAFDDLLKFSEALNPIKDGGNHKSLSSFRYFGDLQGWIKKNA